VKIGKGLIFENFFGCQIKLDREEFRHKKDVKRFRVENSDVKKF
jgi:hypothetical protein